MSDDFTIKNDASGWKVKGQDLASEPDQTVEVEASQSPASVDTPSQDVREGEVRSGQIQNGNRVADHAPLTDASWSRMLTYFSRRSSSYHSRNVESADFRALGLVIRTVEEWDEHASPSPNLAVAQALKEAHEQIDELKRELAVSNERFDRECDKHDNEIKRRNAEWWYVVRKLVAMTAGQ